VAGKGLKLDAIAMPAPHELTKEALGYELHTNRELGMMLRGEKPLSMFSGVDGFFVWVVPRYLRMFDRHANAGRFVRREHRKPIEIDGELRTLVTILYRRRTGRKMRRATDARVCPIMESYRTFA
jgi:hypothetical protein